MHEYELRFTAAKERYGYHRDPTREEIDALLRSAPLFARVDNGTYVYEAPGTAPNAWPEALACIMPYGVLLTVPSTLRSHNAIFIYLMHRILHEWGGIEVCDA